MTFLIPFIFAFVFMCFIVYFFLSLISDFVFGYKEWKIKRRYDNEASKAIAVLPLKWKEEKLQKWYVLIAIIFCGLVWMPSFVVVMDIDYDIDNVIVNDVDDVIKKEEVLSISEKYGIPEPYYLDVEKGTKNISELREALKSIKHLHEYEVYKYDCSEMSSYTEWYLENQGFNISIVGGNRHAWIIVTNIEKISEVHVECTSEPPYIKDSRSYVSKWDNIYEACEGYCPAWDWWLQV